MLSQSPLYAYFPARDLARARRFYEQTLGFSPKSVNNGGVTYQFGGGTGAFLYVTENAGTSISVSISKASRADTFVSGRSIAEVGRISARAAILFI